MTCLIGHERDLGNMRELKLKEELELGRKSAQEAMQKLLELKARQEQIVSDAAQEVTLKATEQATKVLQGIWEVGEREREEKREAAEREREERREVAEREREKKREAVARKQEEKLETAERDREGKRAAAEQEQIAKWQTEKQVLVGRISTLEAEVFEVKEAAAGVSSYKIYYRNI